MTFEVDAHDGVPLVLGGADHHPVPGEPGVVHEHVEAPEAVEGRGDERRGAGPVGDVVAVGDRGAAAGDDLVDDRLRRGEVAAAAVELDAEVVHDHRGALPGQLERVRAGQTPAGAGHDGDAPVTDPHGGGYGTAVRLGVTMFATDLTMTVPDLAREAEDRGLTSLFLPEHTHIPVSRRTPPPTGDAELAEEYRRTVDPFVVLGAAAVVTERIRLGTGICLVAQREPLVTAKAAATLDWLSGGRLEFGVGFGWNREEMADHGVDAAARRAVAHEHVLAMRALWREDVAAFDGEHVRFEASWSWPKPRQPGGPPVLLGGGPARPSSRTSPSTATGGCPSGEPGSATRCRRCGPRATRSDDDPAEVRVVPFGTVPDSGKLEYYASLGIDEVVLRLPAAPRDVVLPVLDRYTPAVARAAELTAAR